MDGKGHLVRKMEDELQLPKAHEMSKENDEIALVLLSQDRNLRSFPRSGRIEDVLEQFLKSLEYRKRLCNELKDQEQLLKMLNRITCESNAPSSHNAQMVKADSNDSRNIFRSYGIMEQEKSAVNEEHYSKRQIQSFDLNDPPPSSTGFLALLYQIDDDVSDQFSTNKGSQGSSLTSHDDQQSSEVQLLEAIDPELNLEEASTKPTDSVEEPFVWSKDAQMSLEKDDLAIFSKLVEHTTFNEDIYF